MIQSNNNPRVRIALPNKGRLSERALEVFELAGLRPAFKGSRALMADLGLDLDMGGKFICTVICCPHMDSLFFI